MKVFISADIEGVAGSAHWDEADKRSPDYAEFRDQMTAETAAACEGALNAGATEIRVKDAHASGRNIIASRLPREAKLTRGWSHHPFKMVQGINASYDALVMVGYHSRAGSNGSPLAHTITGSSAHIRINDTYASEMLINAYTAAMVSVPVVFVSGDAAICKDAESLDADIKTVAVKEGKGDSATSIHPDLAVDQIRQGTEASLRDGAPEGVIELPDHFAVEITYKDHTKAFRSSFYPGAKLSDSRVVHYETDDYMDVLRLLLFVL